MSRIKLFGLMLLFGGVLISCWCLASVLWQEQLDISTSSKAIRSLHHRSADVMLNFFFDQTTVPNSYAASISQLGLRVVNVEFYDSSELSRLNQFNFPISDFDQIEDTKSASLKLPIQANGNVVGFVKYEWLILSYATRLKALLFPILLAVIGFVLFAWWFVFWISRRYIEPIQEISSKLGYAEISESTGITEADFVLQRSLALMSASPVNKIEDQAKIILSQRALYSMPVAIICVDLDGRISEMNPAAEGLTGWPSTQAVGKSAEVVLDMLYSDDEGDTKPPVREVLLDSESKGVGAVYVLIARDGSRHLIHFNAAPVTDDQGAVCGAVLVCQGVSELYETRTKLQQSARILGQVADATPVMIWSMDANRRFSFANQATRDFFESGACSVWDDFVCHADPEDQPKLLQALDQLNASDGCEFKLECRLTNSQGKKIWVYTHVNALLDSQDQILAYVGSSIDISDRKQAESEIERLAFYDSLTGLPNRRLLLDRLGQAIITAQRDRVYGAVFFLDLDNFKTLNDSMGHAVGDQLLVQVADRIRTALRAEDTVARFGGDEFVILSGQLEHLEHESARKARLLGDKIRSILARPYRLGDYECHSTPSIGITLFSQTSTDVEEVLMQADTAMYRAKSDGRNNARFYEPHMQESLINQVAMEKALREALRDKKLALYYQPQVNAEGELTGVEALLRWPQDDGTMLLPLSFLSVAEDTGLIIQIGLWALETACNQLHEWEKQALPEGFTLALNISRRQFVQQDFVLRFEEIIKSSQINPEHLQIEITEKVVKDSMAVAIEKMLDLKQRLRIKISLDDFGTGFSSLTYLRQFPLDQLKIDKSFIRDLYSDPDDAQLTEAILDLGLKMGVEVVAEGVESQQQFDFLHARGCNYFQGFWFGKPLPADQFSLDRRLH